MLPKVFAKEHGYVPFPPFGIPTIAGLVPPALVRADFPPDPQGMPTNATLETVLQNHRRKMLRRAANRRSAQLSRARKKAHLEDLKTENARLQRLVDVLDSQPELVFCVTATGKITYVSERTMNFMKVNFAGEDSDDDPTHVSQILSKESVTEVLEVINKLREYSINRSENDLNMLFSVKMVNFHDAVGHPIVGYLRCSKVIRRASIQDLPGSEPIEKATPPSQQSGPPTKKLKTSKNSSVAKGSSGGSSSNGIKEAVDESAAMMASNPKWNLANFKLLADCVTSITEGKDPSRDSPPSSTDSSSNAVDKKSSANKKQVVESSSSGDGALKLHENGSSGSLTTQSATSSTKSKSDPGTTSPSPLDAEEEFVCVIRTSEDCFVPFRSNKDVLMFSSALSAASIEAHDFELGGANPTDRQAKRRAAGSPVESNNSSSANSLELKTASDSSGQLKHGTSSETGSEEDNNGELDSN